MNQTSMIDKSKQYLGQAQEFLSSGTIVSKIAFIILLLIVFFILLQIGIQIIMYTSGKTGTVTLLNGMVDATQQLIVSGNPNVSNAQTLVRSVNGRSGIEFAWSCWINVNSIPSNASQYLHIFHKGNLNPSGPDSNGIFQPTNAPGLYLTKIQGNQLGLAVLMDTYTTPGEEIIVNNIPLNKWINVVIICKNTLLDVYLNGYIANSTKLNSVPKQNYGDVNIACNGGFPGYISGLTYYNYALGTTYIQSIANYGPSTTLIGNSNISNKSSNYFSSLWYTNENQYNFYHT